MKSSYSGINGNQKKENELMFPRRPSSSLNSRFPRRKKGNELSSPEYAEVLWRKWTKLKYLCSFPMIPVYPKTTTYHSEG
jgi:hypothetical protein